MECPARRGFAAAALSRTVLDSDRDVNLGVWVAEQGLMFELLGGPTALAEAPGAAADHLASVSDRLHVRGVAVVLHQCPTTRPHEPDDSECQAFLRLLEDTMVRSRSNVVVSYGGDALAPRIRCQARAMGVAVVCPLPHDRPGPPLSADPGDARAAGRGGRNPGSGPSSACGMIPTGTPSSAAAPLLSPGAGRPKSWSRNPSGSSKVCGRLTPSEANRKTLRFIVGARSVRKTGQLVPVFTRQWSDSGSTPEPRKARVAWPRL
jgi:hypothetical protein